MKYYIIAGEKSGDLHASNLMKEIIKNDPAADFRFWGGEEMQKVGGIMVKNYNETAFMGFWEVIKHLRTILGFISECKKDILTYKPDVVILVDYAGFNMRIAKFCKKNHILNFYYISPKVWAWNTSRAKILKKVVDKMYVIFPFEVDFFAKFDYKVFFVGNPLLDAISNYKKNENFLADNQLDNQQDNSKKIIAILPGSRKQEIANMLTTMLLVAKKNPQYLFVVAGISNLPNEYYSSVTTNVTTSVATDKSAQNNIKIVFDQTYDLLSHAHSAMVTSGTATLETAVFGVPQVVCYKMSGFTFAIIKRLIKIPYISLVNLILEKKAVEELIQDNFNEKMLSQELQKISENGEIIGEKRVQMLLDCQLLKEKLGTSGASEKTAKLMHEHLLENIKMLSIRMKLPKK